MSIRLFPADLEENTTIGSIRPAEEENDDPSPDITTKRRHDWTTHGFFFLLMCFVSGGAGIAIFYGYRLPQITTFQIQFDSSTSQLENSIQLGLTQKFTASRLLNKLFQHNVKHGYGTSFDQKLPFFTLPGFQDYANEFLTLGGSLRAIVWCPLVDTTNQTTKTSWETWAKQNIAIQTDGLVGNVSMFNAINDTVYKYGIFNQTNNGPVRAGNVVPGSDPRFSNWLFPIWQTAPLAVNVGSMLLELHQTPHNSRQAVESVLSSGYGGTGAFTGVFQLIQDTYYRPATVLFSGVYSLSHTPVLLGISAIVFNWDTLLANALPNNLKRIDCVLTTKSTAVTMAVQHGQVTIVGQKDFHEPAMTSYGQEVVLDVSKDSALSDFTITIYPSSDFYNQYVTQTPVNLSIALGFIVFFVLFLTYMFLLYNARHREKIQSEKERMERSKIKLRKYMEELKRSTNDARKAEEEKKREEVLKMELQENIANSAHDMKSPACALSLAVGSLITTFHGKSHIDKEGCKMAMETLMGMLHTLTSLNTIINRSVDAASKATGNALTPHMDSIEIRTLLNDVMVFMRWQAENSSLAVKLEPYPEHLPTNILADLKWLREDLLCVASNALKFSQERSKAPVIVRLTIDANDDDTTPSMLSFSFLDSGRNLSSDQHLKLFNYPQMRSSDRKSMGGMGLGLYCLRERVTAMGGQCGSRLRHDGLEGTEVWFCIPLLDADDNIKSRTSPKSQAQLLLQQELEVLKKNAAAVGASLDRISNTSFVTALGGTHRCTSSFTSDLSSNRNSFDRNNNNNTASSNGDEINALVPNKSKPARRVRKSSDKSPLLTLKQSFDRISEEKGGVTLPILIVDDSISILKMIRRSLLNEIPDLVIKEARDGHEAFDRVQEEPNGFHIIITDIQMPNCDGFDFTYRVREFEDRNRLSATMVIGMSANYQEKIISQSVRCGMDGFLHKPFELQTLMDVINHVQLHRDITKQLENMQGIASLSRHKSQHFTKERDWKKATPSSPSVTVTTIPPSLSHAV